jgi:DNA-binding response OmpR family regulator
MPAILIVDDEPNIVMSLEFLMRKNGYQVGIARNGNEALAAIAHTPYDLVLLDVMMPDVDGYQVCRTIRESASRAATKVVFLSAKSQPTDVQQGYAAGADLYISKPFSTRQLMEKVRGLLVN